MVVAYKLDRISRDIKDFHSLWTTFEEHGVDFLTPIQMIDTSTSSGKLRVNILLSFAQFEREQITERSVLDTEQRVLKDGKWRGGRAPIGYQADRNLKSIVPFEPEATVVRSIFTDYLSGVARADIAHQLNVSGTRKRSKGSFSNGKFSLKDIDAILNQPAYWGYQIYRKQYLPSNHKEIDAKLEHLEHQKKALSEQLIDVVRLMSDGSLFLRAYEGFDSSQRPLLVQLFIKWMKLPNLLPHQWNRRLELMSMRGRKLSFHRSAKRRNELSGFP